MAESNTATPPAANGGIDLKALNEAIASALAAALPAAIAEANKPIHEAIGKLAPAAPAAAKADADKPLTAESISKLVRDAMAGERQTADQAAARRDFAAQQLKDLPPVYHGQLGNDPTKWKQEADAARAAYRTDLESRGFKVPDVGGNPPANGTTPAKAPVDMSKMSPTALIEMGLKQAGPPPRVQQAVAAS
jgi:hypothetical protein